MEIRGEESVVNNEESFLLFADLCETNNVADLQGWVCWGLSPDDLGCGLECLSDNVEITEIYEVNKDSLSLSENLSEISLGATIDIIDAHDVITRGKEVHDGEECRAATVQGKGVLCVLKRGKVTL